MLILAGLASILALTALTAYFVSQEFAYVAVDRSSLQAEANDGDAAAQRALQVTQRLSFVLSGAQLGITVTALLVGYVSEPLIGQGLSPFLSDAGLPKAASLSIAVAIALLFATIVQMVFGELAAKNFAVARPIPLAKALSRSTLLYLKVAGPVIHVFDSAANKLLRRVGIEPIEELPTGVTSQDLTYIIVESESEGLLDAETARLLDNGLDFRTLAVHQVMIPRNEVVTIQSTERADCLISMLETGHTRFPVVEEGTGNVIGIVGVSDLLGKSLDERHRVSVADIATETFNLPETLPLPKALDEMRNSHRQLACVTDEHGSFAGIITLEDIAEELVGEIRDEDDLPEPTAVDEHNGWWQVPARWRLDEVADATGLKFPLSRHYDTMSGLVMHRLGRVPEVGDTILIELTVENVEFDEPAHRAEIEVLSMHGYVADSLHIREVEGEFA